MSENLGCSEPIKLLIESNDLNFKKSDHIMEHCYMCREGKFGVTLVEHALKYATDRNARLAVLRSRSFQQCRPTAGTALHFLLQNKTIGYVPREEIRLLLGKGFDVNMRDSKGMSALTLCLRSNRLREAEFLVRNGAEVNWLEIIEHTPMLQILTDPKYYHYQREYYHKVVNFVFRQQFNTNIQSLYKILNRGFINQPDNLFYAHVVIAHLIIAEAAGGSIPDPVVKYIDFRIHLRLCYDVCRLRIGELRSIRVNGSVTLLQLLTGSEDEMYTYVSEPDFLSSLQNLISQKCFNRFYYAIIIRKRVDYAMRVMEMEKKSGRVICELTGLCMYGVHEHHYVTYKILGYLSRRDIINLLEDELVSRKSSITLQKTQKVFGNLSKSVKNIFSFH